MNDSGLKQDFRWAAFRKNRFLFFFLLLAWVPIAYIIFLLLKLFLPETAITIIMLIVFFVYGAYWFKARQSYRSFVCPQCGKSFLRKEGSFWGTRWGAKSCMNCGAQIPKKAWSESSLTKSN
jgi:predicted RNA-binding Zn-ribbon protein involved in translation (DUF1610 family)